MVVSTVATIQRESIVARAARHRLPAIYPYRFFVEAGGLMSYGPNLIDGSRKRRIASGSGVQVQDVNRLLKQFLQMQKTMKRFSKGGLQKLLRGMGGRMPPFPRG